MCFPPLQLYSAMIALPSNSGFISWMCVNLSLSNVCIVSSCLAMILRKACKSISLVVGVVLLSPNGHALAYITEMCKSKTACKWGPIYLRLSTIAIISDSDGRVPASSLSSSHFSKILDIALKELVKCNTGLVISFDYLSDCNKMCSIAFTTFFFFMYSCFPKG